MIDFTLTDRTDPVADPDVNPYLAKDEKGNSVIFPIPEGKMLTAVLPTASEEDKKALQKEIRLIQMAAREFGYTARVRRLRVEGDSDSTKITVRTTKKITRK